MFVPILSRLYLTTALTKIFEGDPQHTNDRSDYRNGHIRVAFTFSAKSAILRTVVQFRVVAGTPSSFSIKLLGKPNQPFCLRRDRMNALQSLISKTSRFSLADINGSFSLPFGASDKNVTNMNT